MPDEFTVIPRSDSLPPLRDRLIVALDVDGVEKARQVVAELEGTVSFYKIGLWLLFHRGVNQLIDDLISDGKKVFLDYKMFDIGETVRRGVESAVARNISFVTVHGDPEIMREAVIGRGDSTLKVFGISVLTSQDDNALRAMGYDKTVDELIQLRVQSAIRCGCDGIIASASDNPDNIRKVLNADSLLIATPGIRRASDTADDHARIGTPESAILNGADYLVVGRPILNSGDRADEAKKIIADMERGWATRQQSRNSRQDAG